MNSQGHGPGAAKQGMDITATLGRKQIYDGEPGIAGEEKMHSSKDACSSRKKLTK